MGFYYLEHNFLWHIIDYLSSDLSEFGYRYDSIFNYIDKKERNKIFGFDFGHELYILIKLVEDSGYIKQSEKNSPLFKIVKPIKSITSLKQLLNELPYELNMETLERICIGSTDGNYSKWYKQNKETLKACNCEFLHWDPYNTYHKY